MPTLTAIRPDRVTAGTTATLAILGDQLDGASALTVEGGDLVTAIVSATAGGVLAEVQASPTAAPGTRNFELTTPSATLKSADFGLALAIEQAPVRPALTAIQPDRLTAGRATDTIITGQGLERASSVAFDHRGIIESGRDQPALVKLASEELERIERVATCLHDRLRQLPVEVRLAWVQELSLFDAATDLYHLDQLPRFADILPSLRRELVRFVIWLFERLTKGEAEARALMSDIVRVAILLAGHAPVATLVQAPLARDFTGGVGDVLTVDLPAPKARIGVQVELRTALGQPGAGVVADLVGNSASVRITRAPAGKVSIAATSQIRLFQLPSRR